MCVAGRGYEGEGAHRQLSQPSPQSTLSRRQHSEEEVTSAHSRSLLVRRWAPCFSPG